MPTLHRTAIDIAEDSEPTAEVDEPLRRWAHEAGLVPGSNVIDVRALEPGDLVLFHAKRTTHPIVWFQSHHGFDAPACNITHIAVFLGDDRICHAAMEFRPYVRGVRIESLLEIAADRTLTVLRCGKLGREQRLDIAVRSAAKAGRRYDYSQIASMAYGYVRQKNLLIQWIANTAPRLLVGADAEDGLGQSLICSQLAYVCYDEVLRKGNPLNRSGGGPAPSILPAEIYACPELADVTPSVGRI